MLGKPNIADEDIMACLRGAYGLEGSRVAFLPLGADGKTAVFRATTTGQTDYFVKLRSGAFVETAVVPLTRTIIW